MTRSHTVDSLRMKGNKKSEGQGAIGVDGRTEERWGIQRMCGEGMGGSRHWDGINNML